MHPARRELLTAVAAVEVVCVPKVIKAVALVVAAIAPVVWLVAEADEAAAIALEADPELHRVVGIAERQVGPIVLEVNVFLELECTSRNNGCFALKQRLAHVLRQSLLLEEPQGQLPRGRLQRGQQLRHLIERGDAADAEFAMVD